MNQQTRQEFGDVFAYHCPSRDFLSKISNKWAFLIIHALSDGPLRTSELLRKLEGISRKVLASVLRDLQALGLLSRQQLQIFPPHVTYTLTGKGHSLKQIVVQLDVWVEQNFASEQITI